MKKIILCAVFAVLALTAGDVSGQAFIVVVNAENPASEISKGDLSNIFMKKSNRWPGGASAVPVDNTSAVRDAFSQGVHGRGASAVQAHWQQQIFSGKDVPPAERANDAAVLEFVRGNAGAVGYVSSGATLGTGVKALKVN